MSDTEAELESFNYDNCIVTRHDDSDESCTTNLVLPEPENTLNEPSQQPETDESDFEITRETLEEADLTPEDSFFFVLGMLNRVEKYLNKLEEGGPKQWLTSQIFIIKTVFFKNLKLFNNNGSKINKTVNNKVTKAKKNPRKNGVIARRVTTKTKSQVESCHIYDPQSPEVGTPNHVETSETQLGRRRSQRLLEFAQDRELVHCDRMSLISLKLPSSTPIPQIVKRKVKGQIVESKFLLSHSPIKSKSKRKLNVSQKTPKNNKEKKAGASSGGTNTLSGKRGSKSLIVKSGGQEKMTTQKTRKRRAVSVDRESNKKAKKSADVTTDSTTDSSGINLPSTSRGKRALYSADSWLHSLTMMQQSMLGS